MRDIYWDDEEEALYFTLDQNELNHFDITPATLGKCDFEVMDLLEYVKGVWETIGIKGVSIFSDGVVGVGMEVMCEEVSGMFTPTFCLSALSAKDIDPKALADGLVQQYLSTVAGATDMDDELTGFIDTLNEIAEHLVKNAEEARTEEEPRPEYLGFRSESFDDLVCLVKGTGIKSDAFVIKYGREYHLVFRVKENDKRVKRSKEDLSPQIQDLLSIRKIDESGERGTYSKARIAFLKEHGKVIIPRDAVNVLNRFPTRKREPARFY